MLATRGGPGSMGAADPIDRESSAVSSRGHLLSRDGLAKPRDLDREPWRRRTADLFRQRLRSRRARHAQMESHWSGILTDLPYPP